MKINLNKQKVTSLSDTESSNQFGLGIGRSNRRTGNCGYSRAHKLTLDCDGINPKRQFSCIAATKSNASVGSATTSNSGNPNANVSDNVYSNPRIEGYLSL